MNMLFVIKNMVVILQHLQSTTTMPMEQDALSCPNRIIPVKWSVVQRAARAEIGHRSYLFFQKIKKWNKIFNQIRIEKEYSLQMELRLIGTQPGWSNIFSFIKNSPFLVLGTHGQRIPTSKYFRF